MIRHEHFIAGREVGKVAAGRITFVAATGHIANDTEYGPAAGLRTRDLSRAHRVAARLEAGQVFVDEWLADGVETRSAATSRAATGERRDSRRCITTRGRSASPSGFDKHAANRRSTVDRTVKEENSR